MPSTKKTRKDEIYAVRYSPTSPKLQFLSPEGPSYRNQGTVADAKKMADGLGLLRIGRHGWVRISEIEMVMPADRNGVIKAETGQGSVKGDESYLPGLTTFLVGTHGFLELTTGALANPAKLVLREPKNVSMHEDTIIPLKALTVEARKRVDAMPWVTMPSGLKVNPNADLSNVSEAIDSGTIDIKLIEKARTEIAAKTKPAAKRAPRRG